MTPYQPPKRRRLYLMRHGSVSYFLPNGQAVNPLTVSLNSKGVQQAIAAGQSFQSAKVSFDRVVCSGLNRTVETAQQVLAQTGQQIAIEVVSDLREIEGGRLDQLPKDDVAQSFLKAFDTVGDDLDVRFLGGESLRECRDRVLPAFQQLLDDPSWDCLLLVLHGGVNRVILSHLLQPSGGFLGRIEQAPACINAIDLAVDQTALIRSLNFVAYDPLSHATRHTTLESLLQQFLSFRKSP
jgi:broad specificity phosphatase PhoE